MTGDTECVSNQLLAALPAEVLARWRQRLERVDMPLGLVLYESGDPQIHAYFPCTAVVSLVHSTALGGPTEIGVIGNEGLVGIALFTGGETRPNRAVVQCAGSGYRLKADVLKAEFDRCVLVKQLFLKYMQALIAQTAQTAVCNRHHAVDQQLCRWLLMSKDRAQGDELTMTQEGIAHTLGVRRESVTEAALKLQCAGLIRYARGRITIVNRPGLERRSCECYAVVKAEYARLLPTGPATGPLPASVSQVQRICLDCNDQVQRGRGPPKCANAIGQATVRRTARP